MMTTMLGAASDAMAEISSRTMARRTHMEEGGPAIIPGKRRGSAAILLQLFRLL